MKRIYFAWVIVTTALLSGCAAPAVPALSTPSGRPEVTIANVTRKQVIDAIVASAASRGSTIKSVNDYGIVLAKRLEGNFGASFVYGSRYDSVPEARIHLNLVEVGQAVKVFGRGEIVTNPGSAFERVTDLTEGSGGHEIQRSLEEIRSKLGG